MSQTTTGTGSDRQGSTHRGRSHRGFGVAAGAAILIAATAGCASSGNASAADAGNTTEGSTTAATSACMAAANAYLQPYRTLPTKLPASYTPLSKKPKPGGSVIAIVNGSIPQDSVAYDNQMQAAAAAIGWTSSKIVQNGSVEDLNAKFEEAISRKPTAIIINGNPLASIVNSVTDAKKAGIIVVFGDVLDVPTSVPGYAGLTDGANSAKAIGKLQANMFMHDSGCKGSVAIFNLPFPILTAVTNSFTATVKARCPDCKVSYNELQASDIGTPAATTAIVSALQSSPSTKYVYTIIGNVADGLNAALSAAGITGIKIFGENPDQNAIQALRDNTNAWWVDQTSQLTGWTEMDALLRVLDTGRPYNDIATYPLSVLTPENVPSGGSVPVEPPDYEQQFLALWHVSA